eukprot:COSAG03_NODE_16051_length_413_cov_0.700637_1_plen_22_part_10
MEIERHRLKDRERQRKTERRRQ